ncbi:hypothetical protein [Micromonospora sp. KC721]|uniref:hypothetical protein n=1 Tax=Micromonospora sp. KC721 TaxID=2530380 RepID=UPI00104CE7FE|nr:hypothetical protein [Micromonospora sp. KC721]TDB79212.1 hypothetical protein E1182_13365 [Micromonospora sp. KC721]
MAVTNQPRAAAGYGTAAGTGAIAALILVGVCGSPWYVAWAEANTDPSSAGGWFLRLLAWPAWRLTAVEPGQGVLATDLRAILLVVFAVVFLYLLPTSQVARVQGSLNQFFSGWAAYVLAGAVGTLLAALLTSGGTLLADFQTTQTGAAYGFFAGWVVGLASLGGRA